MEERRRAALEEEYLRKLDICPLSVTEHERRSIEASNIEVEHWSQNTDPLPGWSLPRHWSTAER
eukprot:UN18049